jgi:RimJ/RimL family protein N-acetyltransferase
MTLRPCAQLPELLIRPIRPDDKDALVAGLGRLSERSVYQRFLSPKPKLTASELRYLTEVDFADHYALVAVLARRPEVIVAVGRWVRDTDDPSSAEVAIVVADDLQSRGVGTTLGRWLARTAVERDVARFTATMLPSNQAAHRLFAKISEQLDTTRRLGGVDELTAPLAAA